MDILEVGIEYLIIYNDGGFKPVKKVGVVTKINNVLFTLASGEVLNKERIIRAKPVERGKNGEIRKD